MQRNKYTQQYHASNTPNVCTARDDDNFVAGGDGEGEEGGLRGGAVEGFMLADRSGASGIGAGAINKEETARSGLGDLMRFLGDLSASRADLTAAKSCTCTCTHVYT